jgi:hypothetical protein
MENSQTREPFQSEERPEYRRRKRWPTFLAVLIVLAAIAGIVAYDYYIGRFKRSEPYQRALKLIQNDKKAMDQLGSPIKDATSLLERSIPSGSLYTAGDGGEATLLFKVSGPKAQADVLVKARRTKGKWDLNSVDLTLPAGNKLSVEVPSDAPVFVPGGGGVEPPSRKLPEPPSGKPAIPGPKEPAAPGPSVDIPVPKL